MFINSIPQTNFKAKVPLSEYKGVILKLTEEEKIKIADLMNKKSMLIMELTSIEDKLNKEKTVLGSRGLFDIYDKLNYQIKNLDKEIKQIKINRKNQQIKELEGLDLMM